MMAIPEREFLSRRFFTWSVLILLSYFGLRLLFLAFIIPPFGPPDEVTHFGCSRIFSQVLLLPDNSPETYQFGLVTNIPWLYYWIMGKFLHLNFFGVPDLLFLRLLNIPFAFGTVFYLWRTFRLLTADRLGALLLLVAITNTLMFTFLSAAVSYDNLTNLLAAMAVYYLLAFFKERSGNLLAASLACQLAGCLTKNTMLPLVLVLNLLLFIGEFRNLRVLPAALWTWLRASGVRGLVATAVIIAALALNIQLYGGNYLHYGSLAPEMYQVLPMDAAMQNRLAAREVIFKSFKEGNTSREQALALTARIDSASDRADTLALIENHQDVLDGRIQMLDLPAYIQIWVFNILGTVYGVKCQMGMLPEHLWGILCFAGVMLLSVLGFLVRWRPGKDGWLAPCLALCASFYLLFLLFAVCYRGYLYYEQPGIGLQGRYVFPVLGPIYVLVCYYLLDLFQNSRIRLAVAAVAALLFLGCDLPYLLTQAPRYWFMF